MINETAPERIWANLNVSPIGDVLQGTLDLEPSVAAAQVEYVRDDISEIRTERVRAELEAAQARIAELERENAIIRAAKSGITYVCPECDIAGCKHARAALEGKR